MTKMRMKSHIKKAGWRVSRALIAVILKNCLCIDWTLNCCKSHRFNEV